MEAGGNRASQTGVVTLRPMLKTDLLRIAMVFDGQREIPGTGSNPIILAILKQSAGWFKDDDEAWCGAFVQAVVKIGRAGDSRLAIPEYPYRARRWMTVGAKVTLERARPGFDVVVVRRNGGPGPEILDAVGHVGFYVRHEDGLVTLYGGNQRNMVCEAVFPVADILGIRRL